MKKKKLMAMVLRAFAPVIFLAAVQSCDMLGVSPGDGGGELRIAFASNQESLTRSGLNIPDTSDFILSIRDAKGNSVYEGPYGASPESVFVKAGTYTVNIISEEFNKPSFSLPQFGDEQCVKVASGSVVNLKLVCRQMNAGIRMYVEPSFLKAYSDGVLLLKSSFGRLVYGYSERRIAYFKPGNVSLVLSNGGSDEILMTRELKAQDMLELKVKVASSGNQSQNESERGKVSVAVDTTRNWMSGEYVIGGSSGGGDHSDALTVAEAMNAIGEEDVWVSGYIVGGDLSSSSASFEKPFSSRTNILIGPRSATTDKSSCLSVQLPAGELRDDLNLVDNPGLLGRKVCLRGDIVEAYYSIPGIKNISEYELL